MRASFYGFKNKIRNHLKTLILKTWQNIGVYTKQVKRDSSRFQFWCLQEHFENETGVFVYEKNENGVIWKR